MSDIIAGDPAPTKTAARDELASYADRYGYTDEVNALLDAYRAEVLAERDAKLLCSALNLGEGADAFIADYDARKRAEVLAEAAVVALNLRQFEKAFGARAGAQVSENVGIIRVADELMRLADGGESRG